jgi:hypothetical protein
MPARSTLVAWLRLVALPLVFLAATATGPAPRVDEQGAAWVQPFQKANTKSIDARARGIDYALRDTHASPFAPAATVRFELETTGAMAVVRGDANVRADAPVVLHLARAPPTLS